jgi:hypothetical protein
MVEQFPSIDVYREKLKTKFPEEKVDESALVKAYRFIKDEWEGIAFFYLKIGEKIPSDLIEKRDHVILELYEIYSAPNKSMSKKH